MKKPVSVLVVIYTPELNVLLIERTKHPGYWQSVTGSQEGDEPLAHTARRELAEETGLNCSEHELVDWRLTNRFEILPLWRHRYAEGVTHNDEHVFSVCVPKPFVATLAPDEHRDQVWLPWQTAAQQCFSWSNQDAIRMLPHRTNSER